MKRSLQEVVELVVFGLVALLIGTGLLWVVGWLLSLGGLLLKAIAGLLWLLLRFVVPVAIVAGLVYFVVKALQNQHDQRAASPAGAGGSTAGTTAATAAAATASAAGAVPTASTATPVPPASTPGPDAAEGVATTDTALPQPDPSEADVEAPSELAVEPDDVDDAADPNPDQES